LTEELVVCVDLPLRLVLLVHVEIDDEKGLHFVRHDVVLSLRE